MRIHAFLGAALGALLLPACASMAHPGADRESALYLKHAGQPIPDFTSFGLDGWVTAGRDRLVVTDGPGKAYLIQVQQPCTNLKFASTIGVTSTGRTISRLEHVRVGRERCQIAEIRVVDLKALRLDKSAMRAMEKPGEDAAP